MLFFKIVNEEVTLDGAKHVFINQIELINCAAKQADNGPMKETFGVHQKRNYKDGNTIILKDEL
jgi:hypothetical protein